MGGHLWWRFLLKTAFRNLWRSPRRTAVSLVAIAMSAAALILFQSFVEGVKSTFRQNVITSRFGHFQVAPAGEMPMAGDDNLTRLISENNELRREIESATVPLKFMSRQLSFFGLLSSGERSTGGRGIGIDAEEEAKFLTLAQVHAGRELAGASGNSLYLGVDLAKKLGVEVGTPITVLVTTAKGSMNAVDLDLVGTFKSGVTEMDENVFFVHFATAETLLRVKGAQRILFGFDGPNELIYRQALQRLVRDKYPALQLMHWQELAAYFTNTMGWLEGMFKVIRIIILIIATLSIVNVFTITLLERTGEFGTLRAIGTSRAEITAMIFVEALMQAFIGTLFGIAAGVLAITLGLKGGISMPPPLLMSVPFHVSFSVPWQGVGITLALCVVIAGGSGIFPALKMARINIVEALGRNI